MRFVLLDEKDGDCVPVEFWNEQFCFVKLKRMHNQHEKKSLSYISLQTETETSDCVKL